jgi:hypothetical protein
MSADPALVRSRQPAARQMTCFLAAYGAYRLRRGQPGPIPFQASRASRGSGAQHRTRRRFLWLQMFKLEHCRPGHAGSSSQRWSPQPALTELACVAGAMVSLCRRWRDRCAGLSQTCSCFGVNVEGLEELLRLQIAGPKTTIRKVLDPTAADR